MFSVLLSNDDGYLAPGLQLLAGKLREQASVDVVAPDRDRSGASNSLTLDRPLRPMEVAPRVWKVDGTPTDCVHLGLTGLLSKEPDLVMSGINAGANLGDDTIYSGTVAAAMEGRSLGLPAVAVSLVLQGQGHYETAAHVALHILRLLSEAALPASTILNVNVPDVPLDALRGIQVTRLGRRHKAEGVIATHDPRGRPIYWMGPPGPGQDAGPGTDFHAVENRFASVTPLHIDLTRYDVMDRVRELFDANDNNEEKA